MEWFPKIMEWSSSDLRMNSSLPDMNYNALLDLAPIFFSKFISLPFVPSNAF